MTSAAGYSGKPLAEKLGLKAGQTLVAIDPPADYAALLAPLPEGATIAGSAISADIVHAFVRNHDALLAATQRLVAMPKVGGALWISWPKKTSFLFADLTENGLREAILPTGWVDVKVCAVDQDWSGLKFLKRRSAPAK